MDLQRITPGSTLADLPSHDVQLDEDALGSRVAAALQLDANLPGVIIRRRDGSFAIVSRQGFFQQLSLQYSREVYLVRPIAIFLQATQIEPLRLEASSGINDAASMALRRPQPTVYEPLLVELEPSNVRLLDMHVLLQAQSHLLAVTHMAMLQNEKLAGLGQLAAGVAHEINNPLSFVINNAAVLQRDLKAIRKILELYQRGDDVLAEHRTQLKAEIDELVERIDLPYTLENIDDSLNRSNAGMRRIQRIVQDLRGFVRLDESDHHFVDLNEGIASTVNIIRHRAESKDVSINLQLTPLPEIPCYPARINQVVLNLLANAIDASAPGAVIEVRSRLIESEASIEVIDTGYGIDPRIRHRIFDPFFTTKPVGAGAGLGLSVSYGIVRDHGGRIEVESEPGRGSTFRVCLPLAVPNAAPVPTLQSIV
jgi:signal transduction histidine kinase